LLFLPRAEYVVFHDENLYTGILIRWLYSDIFSEFFWNFKFEIFWSLKKRAPWSPSSKMTHSNIHTLLDLLSKTEEDLMRIDSFRMEDGKHIRDNLEKYLPTDLLKSKLSF
jgi:hypothetical protein